MAQSFTLDDERLDYLDWDLTDAGEGMEAIRNTNDILEKELKRVRKINNMLSAEWVESCLW